MSGIRLALPEELSRDARNVLATLKAAMEQAERSGIMVLAIMHDPADAITVRTGNVSNGEGMQLLQIAAKVVMDELEVEL
jgi:hypothetical protein